VFGRDAQELHLGIVEAAESSRDLPAPGRPTDRRPGQAHQGGATIVFSPWRRVPDDLDRWKNLREGEQPPTRWNRFPARPRNQFELAEDLPMRPLHDGDDPTARPLRAEVPPDHEDPHTIAVQCLHLLARRYEDVALEFGGRGTVDLDESVTAASPGIATEDLAGRPPRPERPGLSLHDLVGKSIAGLAHRPQLPLFGEAIELPGESAAIPALETQSLGDLLYGEGTRGHPLEGGDQVGVGDFLGHGGHGGSLRIHPARVKPRPFGGGVGRW
jgi:hypothetical protein